MQFRSHKSGASSLRKITLSLKNRSRFNKTINELALKRWSSFKYLLTPLVNRKPLRFRLGKVAIFPFHLVRSRRRSKRDREESIFSIFQPKHSKRCKSENIEHPLHSYLSIVFQEIPYRVLYAIFPPIFLPSGTHFPELYPFMD